MRKAFKKKPNPQTVKTKLAEIIPLYPGKLDQFSYDGKIDQREYSRTTGKSKSKSGRGKKITKTANNLKIDFDKNDLFTSSENMRFYEPALSDEISDILKQAGIQDSSKLRSVAGKIERLIVREIRNVVISGGIFERNNQPKIELPALAPELYAERLDKKETPVNFLDRVWGKYLEAGVLYQCDLRGKNGRDPKLMHAIVSYCTVRKLNISSYIPSKKDKTEREVLNFSLNTLTFLNEPERFLRAAMAFYQREKRLKEKHEEQHGVTSEQHGVTS
jgi:hypothetical protein